MRRKILKPPSGLSRILFRSPIFLYQLGLGWLLGQRFVQITHIGRKSGQPRRTVVEVVKRDRNAGIYYVVSAWGDHADWYLNLMQDPQCEIRVAGKHYDAHAVRLPDAEAEEVLLDYAERHPATLRSLMSFMGFEVDGSKEKYRKVARQMPFLALQIV